jgi:2-aminobenzoate-CoA ligase
MHARHTALVDPFVLDRLPRPPLAPDLIYDLPHLHFPQRLNAGRFLLDAAFQKAKGEPLCRSDDLCWSADELNEKACSLAALLQKKYGLLPGQRVVLRSPNSPFLMAALLGIFLAGGIAVPGSPLLGPSELHHVLSSTRPALVLCGSDQDPNLDMALQKAMANSATPPLKLILDADLLIEAAAFRQDFTAINSMGDDPALILFTSGTSGRPKGAVHSHKAIAALARGFGDHLFAAGPGDLVFGSPSLGFAYGFGLLFVCPLAAGACCLLSPDGRPDALLDDLVRHRPTMLVTVPTVYFRLLASKTNLPTASLRRCFSAGEPLSQTLAESWEARTGVPVLDLLGSTEMLGPYIASEEKSRIPGCAGRAVPGYELKILDKEGAALRPGSTGRLAVRGPTGAQFLDPRDQAGVIKDGWTLTGDLCRLDRDGRIWFKGRADDMILSSGHSIAAIEVEKALMSHPAVDICAVTGLPDADRGQLVAALVVLRPDDSDQQGAVDARALIDHVKASIAPYKAPRRIAFVESLPRTPSGKIRRTALGSMFGDDIQ